MRILLIGRSGQVAWELRRTLQPLGEVVALSCQTTPSLDLRQPGRLSAILQEIRPDLIVNAAAYTAVDRAEEEPELAFRINSEAVGVLGQTAAKIGAVVIHYSTDYVFDGQSRRPYREDDPTAPLNIYGASKLEGEKRLVASGAPYLIFRTSWVYGPRGKNFLLTMLRLFREREVVRVVADQIGAPTSSRLIAEATAQIIARKGTALPEVSGIYHLTASGKTSWHGFAMEIYRLARKEGILSREVEIEAIPTEAYPTPAKRPRYSVLDNRKLKEVFDLWLPDWRIGLVLVLEELATR